VPHTTAAGSAISILFVAISPVSPFLSNIYLSLFQQDLIAMTSCSLVSNLIFLRGDIFVMIKFLQVLLRCLSARLKYKSKMTREKNLHRRGWLSQHQRAVVDFLPSNVQHGVTFNEKE